MVEGCCARRSELCRGNEEGQFDCRPWPDGKKLSAADIVQRPLFLPRKKHLDCGNAVVGRGSREAPSHIAWNVAIWRNQRRYKEAARNWPMGKLNRCHYHAATRRTSSSRQRSFAHFR